MSASGSLFPTGKTIVPGEPSLCGSVLAWGRGDMVKVKLLLLSFECSFSCFCCCCCCLFGFGFFVCGQGDDSPSPLGSGIFTKVFLSVESC